MKGLLLIKELTGACPVYPGHPLVVAVQIMSTFGSIAEASAPTEHGWPEALGNSDISGAGCHVGAGLRILQRGAAGASPDDMIYDANRYWTEGSAGGHTKNVASGTTQAHQLEAHFRARVVDWLAAGPPPHSRQQNPRGLHLRGPGTASTHEPT